MSHRRQNIVVTLSMCGLFLCLLPWLASPGSDLPQESPEAIEAQRPHNIVVDGMLFSNGIAPVDTHHDSTCKAERLYPGSGSVTLMAASCWIDAKTGIWHYHDPSNTTTSWGCSEGHTWVETTTPRSCPAGD